jgi:ubiquitin
MQLFVKTLTGAPLSVEVAPGDTVDTLKQTIQDRHGISADLQRLVYNGKALGDGKTLTDYNIQAGSTLGLILTIRGD